MTVDHDLVEAANDAVAAGHADSLSGWVNLALRERAMKERRLDAMAKAVAEYESVFGEITAEEMVAQERADRTRARVVRGRSDKTKRAKRKSA
mgnify:CR=1 FL=1